MYRYTHVMLDIFARRLHDRAAVRQVPVMLYAVFTELFTGKTLGRTRLELHLTKVPVPHCTLVTRAKKRLRSGIMIGNKLHIPTCSIK